jgi:hypothetical protein
VVVECDLISRRKHTYIQTYRHCASRMKWWSQDSVLCMLTRLRLGRLSIRIPAGEYIFLYPKHVHRRSFLGVIRPGRYVDLSSPSSSEIKNVWSYASAPPICSHGFDSDSTFTSNVFILYSNNCSLAGGKTQVLL